MDTINTIELKDEEIYPDDAVLKTILGKAYSAYSALLKMYENNEMKYEWRYYKDGKSWLCKVQKKNKTILWMSVWKDFIQACIYCPERHIEDVLSMDISNEIKEKIKNTKNIGKSRPCIFEVRDIIILDDIEKIMNYKIKLQ